MRSRRAWTGPTASGNGAGSPGAVSAVKLRLPSLIASFICAISLATLRDRFD